MMNALLKLLNQQKQRSKKGFTLVELIVVIAILGILAALVVPSVSGYVEKAQTATNEANAQMLYSAAQLYLTDMDVAGQSIGDVSTGITAAILLEKGYIQKALPDGDKVEFSMNTTSVGDEKNPIKVKDSLVMTYTPNGKAPITLGNKTT